MRKRYIGQKPRREWLHTLGAGILFAVLIGQLFYMLIIAAS